MKFHVVGGGRNADGPVWFVIRRDDLHDWCVAEASTRASARQKAQELAAEYARLAEAER